MSHREREQRDDRWELASQAAQEGIWDWDLRTQRVYRSDYWFSLFGYEPGELADNPWVWENMIHPEDVARVLQTRRDHIEGRTDRYYTEHRMLCKDGQYRWFLTRGQLIRDEQGTPIRMLGFYTNIDQRVALKEQLVRQNKALLILNEISLRAIEAADPDVTLTYLLNRAREFMAADKAYLYLHNKKDDLMRAHSLCGFIGPSILKIRRGEFLAGQVWETGEYAYLENFDQWPGRPPTPDSTQIKTALGMPMKIGPALVGVLTMGFQTHRTVADDEREIIRQLAAIAALVVHNRDKSLKGGGPAEKSTKPDSSETNELRVSLLNSLIDGQHMTQRELTQRARKSGLTAQAGYLAMVAEVGSSDSLGCETLAELAPAEGCCWWREGKLYLFCPGQETLLEKMNSLTRATEIQERIQALTPGEPVRIGLGLPFSSLREVGTAFQQACEAVYIGSRLSPGKLAHHYLDVGLIHVLSQHKDRRYIEMFMRQALGKLIDHDYKKRAHLVETLAAIVKTPSLREAAEAMFIHTKTLLFRKHKIEELLGESLDDSAVRLNLFLAVQLYGVNADWGQPLELLDSDKPAE